MNRIDQTFARLRASGRRALIAYITAGDPSLAVTEELVAEIARSGADMIEIGVPFSDPVADGPVIQAASTRALKNGVTFAEVLTLAGKLQGIVEIPLLVMTYYNPILAYGISRFVEDASKNGIAGVIVPDLPLEESEKLSQALAASGIHFIHLLAPTSSTERINDTVERSSGFIYCVSVSGVTGARDSFPGAGKKLLGQVGALTNLPLALGFGISSPEQVADLDKQGDAVIIGSAIVKLVEEGGSTEEILGRVGTFLKSFGEAGSLIK